MVAGAPRTTSLQPAEMIELGKEMISWVENHPEILHLSEWYTIEKMFTYNQWKVFKVCEEFSPYYKTSEKKKKILKTPSLLANRKKWSLRPNKIFREPRTL